MATKRMWLYGHSEALSSGSNVELVSVFVRESDKAFELSHGTGASSTTTPLGFESDLGLAMKKAEAFVKETYPQHRCSGQCIGWKEFAGGATVGTSSQARG
jgi:hypothetical protein